ncbi:MAG TPA: acyl-CoA dehydrogenase family protein [Polyangiaceae bacterium]|nr:acyl-CoA dehydrogenase family protein [Polyangiaceae bacterium]
MATSFVDAPRIEKSRTSPTPEREAPREEQREPARDGGALLELSYELRDFDCYPLSPLLRSGSPRLYEQCKTVITRTREYTERHLRGRVEAWDLEVARDHAFVPWAAIDGALDYGFLSLNVPAVFGGFHGGPLAACVFAEELSAMDAGIYVIYGAHALAWSLILASLDTRVIARVGREIASGEKQGRPVLLALAHTEPSGGSDVEDTHDIQNARFGSRYEKVDGGYLVDARKVFISNGSIARYNVLTAIGDPKRPLQTMRGFLIRQDCTGFSLGRIERKLGQRLSTAAEVICDSVFVSEEDSFDLGNSGRTVDTTLSLSRGPVGAMATGIIRGTLERTLAYLSHKHAEGHLLHEEQWVRLALADMLGALQAARGVYMDAALASEFWGLGKLLDVLPSILPEFLSDSPALDGVLGHRAVVARGRSLYESLVGDERLERLVAHASLAKFTCGDSAVRVAMTAMEILGEDANDPRWGVEKCMRDAKLAQIFEGTNQINRLHVARGFLRSRTRAAR